VLEGEPLTEAPEAGTLIDGHAGDATPVRPPRGRRNVTTSTRERWDL
jgi:hypothetical protein